MKTYEELKGEIDAEHRAAVEKLVKMRIADAEDELKKMLINGEEPMYRVMSPLNLTPAHGHPRDRLQTNAFEWDVYKAFKVAARRGWYIEPMTAENTPDPYRKMGDKPGDEIGFVIRAPRSNKDAPPADYR